MQFEYKGATITLHEPTNRRRELSRKVAQKLSDQDLSPTTRTEFSTIVAHTKSVENGWMPPNPHASKEDLIEGLDYWLDHIETELTDKWVTAIFNPNTDPVTSPNALPDDSDPNS